MDKNKNLFTQIFPENGDNREVIEDTLDCLLRRLTLLESVVNQRSHQMKERLQEIMAFKVWCPSEGINKVMCRMWAKRMWLSKQREFWYQKERQVFSGFSENLTLRSMHRNHYPKFELLARWNGSFIPYLRTLLALQDIEPEFHSKVLWCHIW